MIDDNLLFVPIVNIEVVGGMCWSNKGDTRGAAAWQQVSKFLDALFISWLLFGRALFFSMACKLIFSWCMFCSIIRRDDDSYR